MFRGVHVLVGDYELNAPESSLVGWPSREGEHPSSFEVPEILLGGEGEHVPYPAAEVAAQARMMWAAHRTLDA